MVSLCADFSLTGQRFQQTGHSERSNAFSINIDLSKNHNVEDRYILIRHLPMKSLNLENNFFWYKWAFRHYSLQTLNIRNTQFRKIDYDTLRDTRLKKIKLTKKQYEESDIRGPVRDKLKYDFK